MFGPTYFDIVVICLAGALIGAIVGAAMRRPVWGSMIAGAVGWSILTPILYLLGLNPGTDWGAKLAPVVVAGGTALIFNFVRSKSGTSRLGSDGSLHDPFQQSARETVFISYRRDDSLEATGRIYDRLSREFGDGRVFRDLDSMPLGVDFREHIDQRLSDCNICLVVIGPKFLTVTDASGTRRIDDPRDHVRIEIETALRRDIRVVPLLVGGAMIPVESQLPASLASLAYRAGTQIRPDPDFHRDIDRLMGGLRIS